MFLSFWCAQPGLDRCSDCFFFFMELGCNVRRNSAQTGTKLTCEGYLYFGLEMV